MLSKTNQILARSVRGLVCFAAKVFPVSESDTGTMNPGVHEIYIVAVIGRNLFSSYFIKDLKRPVPVTVLSGAARC